MRNMCALFFFVASTAWADELWVAKANFGPDLKGTLTIQDQRAEIAGRVAAVSKKGDRLTFEIPDGGAFRGTIKGDRIAGHWIQPPVSGLPFATPVLLRKQAGRWRGEVRPLDDHMTYFLAIKSNGEAFLSNPERNAGR